MPLILATETVPGEADWTDSNVLGSGAPEKFVFRPGNPAGQVGNVYPTFAPLYAAALAASGKREIVVDTTYASATIPNGIYDFLNIAVSDGDLLDDRANAFLGNKTTLSFGNNVQIRNAYSFKNLALVGPPAGVQAPLVYDDGTGHFTMFRNTLLSKGGALGPPVLLSTGAGTITAMFFDGLQGGLNNAGGPPIRCENNAKLSFAFIDRTSASTNTISGDATSGTGSIGFSADSKVSLVAADQPNWLGTLSPVERFDESFRVAFDASGGAWSAPAPIEVQDALARMNVAWQAMNAALAAALVPGFPLPNP